jgi:hypothetical protein
MSFQAKKAGSVFSQRVETLPFCCYYCISGCGEYTPGFIEGLACLLPWTMSNNYIIEGAGDIFGLSKEEEKKPQSSK